MNTYYVVYNDVEEPGVKNNERLVQAIKSMQYNEG